jgi:ubiquinone/menaquinone biosynthesis C-methylase UbiE
MTALGKVHSALVFSRRIQVLARELAKQIPRDSRVLDVGCGSGDIAAAIMAQRPDVTIEGVDVLVRTQTRIPVLEYDGRTLPHPDGGFDVAMLVDVLHHTDDPAAVLAEAKRVARVGVLVKDHFRDGMLAGPTLRFMDWVGNAPHGVRLPYNYLSSREWRSIWDRLRLTPTGLCSALGLYPPPFTWLFDRTLHFVTLLKI